MNMRNQVCLICRQKNSSHKLDKLKNMNRMLKGRVPDIEVPINKIRDFRWNISGDKCRYGIYCPTLDNFRVECQNIATKLIPMLIQVAEGNDETLYHMALQGLRGDFPDAYRQMEMIHVKERLKKRKEKETDDGDNRKKAASY